MGIPARWTGAFGNPARPAWLGSQSFGLVGGDMSEVITYLESSVRGNVLRGIAYAPDRDGPHPTVVLHHGFGAQRMEGFGLFVTLSRTLAAQGFAAIAFDRAGQGESDGAFADVTVTGDVGDSLELLDKVRSIDAVDSNEIHLLGLSMGAVIASHVAARSTQPVRSLTLLSAAASFVEEIEAGTLQGMTTAHVDQDGYFDFFGRELGAAFFADAEVFDVYGGARGYTGPVRVLHGDEDFIPPRSVERYRNVFGQRLHYTLVPGGDHGWTTVAARKVVIDEAIGFISSTSATGAASKA